MQFSRGARGEEVRSGLVDKKHAWESSGVRGGSGYLDTNSKTQHGTGFYSPPKLDALVAQSKV